MATSAPYSPTRRRVVLAEADTDENRSPQRMGVSEIPRTYSGLYGAGAPPMPDIQVESDGDEDGDSAPSPPRAEASSSPSQGHAAQAGSNLLPFELLMNRNTEWIAASGPALLVTYLSIILAFLLTLLAYVTEPRVAWTAGNASHTLASIVYLHWIKGNPADFMDGTQGEMNAMTMWEQIVCKPARHLDPPPPAPPRAPGSRPGSPRDLRGAAADAVKKLRSRDVLVVVPTLLALASCYVAEFQFGYAVANVGMWAVLMLPKMPAMNGVRILGINRTAGIDDGEEKCLDAEEDTSKETGVGTEANDDVILIDHETDELKKDR